MTHSPLQENFWLQGSGLSSLFCCVFGKLDARAGFELCENEALVLSVGCSSQKFGFREAYSIPRTRKRKLALEVIMTWALFYFVYTFPECSSDVSMTNEQKRVSLEEEGDISNGIE